MCVLERRAEIASDVQEHGGRQLHPLLRADSNEGGQGAALNQLDGHVRPAIEHTRIHHPDDVRMVERRTDSRLASKARQKLLAHGRRVSEQLRQHSFEGDPKPGTVLLDARGLEGLGHAAPTEQLPDLVLRRPAHRSASRWIKTSRVLPGEMRTRFFASG